MILSSGIFILTYIFIITEKADRVVVALGGGILMILSGLLTDKNAFGAIDLNTLALLISMMVIVMVMKRTGVFEYLAIKMVKLAKGEPWKIMVYLSLVTAFFSAFLDNVTTILLILPITLDITKELHLKLVPFVISQVFASNIGGTATLIGDPPNILIGSQANLSFVQFLQYDAPIIILILPFTIAYFILIYKKYLHTTPDLKQKVLLMNENEAIKNKKLLIMSLSVLALTITGFVLHGTFHFESSTIAVAGAVTLLLISRVNTEKILKEVEWKTIFFFTGLFMLVEGIKKAGVLNLIAESVVDTAGKNLPLMIILVLWVSAIVSAFVDNIPFTTIMIPLIHKVGALSGISVFPLWWALSLGACLGGNGTIIGASANVVAAGMAEDYGHKITFAQYFKVCFPIMLVTIAISMVYLLLRFV
ncbi:MAG: ArsB/NhaD family transporter [Clostridia bacterium]|nr:ArsB/NhaD family transporter [Clostridia bacterium]